MVPPDPPASDDAEAGLNVSLHEVMDLMAQEVDRLQAALDSYRLSDHPQKEALVRWHVAQIDERQDRLDELKRMLLSRDGTDTH